MMLMMARTGLMMPRNYESFRRSHLAFPTPPQRRAISTVERVRRRLRQAELTFVLVSRVEGEFGVTLSHSLDLGRDRLEQYLHEMARS